MYPGIADINRKLVENCKAGSRKAQYELYNSYAKAMYNICFRMMNNAEEAKDMLQESFIEAFRQIDTYRFESAFGAWLKRIVVNKCINSLEKRRIKWVDEAIPEDLPEASDAVDEQYLELSVERVKRAMNQLPEGARIIFSLFLLEGYDHSEISEILHISESTSKTQFMRARLLVKEILLSMPALS